MAENPQFALRAAPGRGRYGKLTATRNPLLTELLAKHMPEAADADQRLRALVAAEGRYRPEGESGATQRAIYDALAKGQDLPSTLVDTAAQELLYEQAFQRTYAEIAQVAEALAAERDSHIDVDPMLGDLDGRVKATVARARALAGVFDLTAEGALNGDRVDEWRQVGQVRQQYIGIRRVQLLLMRVDIRNHIPDEGDMSDFDAIDSAMRREGYDGYNRIALVDNATQLWPTARNACPWPMLGMSASNEEHLEMLSWLVATPAAVPWVPTTAQFEKRLRAHQRATRATVPQQPTDTDVYEVHQWSGVNLQQGNAIRTDEELDALIGPAY